MEYWKAASSAREGSGYLYVDRRRPDLIQTGSRGGLLGKVAGCEKSVQRRSDVGFFGF